LIVLSAAIVPLWRLLGKYVGDEGRIWNGDPRPQTTKIGGGLGRKDKKEVDPLLISQSWQVLGDRRGR